MGKKIVAEAPLKIIVSGDHAVVHGAPAMAIAVSPLNKVTLEEEAGMGYVFRGSFTEIALDSQGKALNATDWSPGLEALVQYFIKEYKLAPKARLAFTVTLTGAPKGMGASASIGAAVSLVLFAYVGKKPTKQEVFDATQVVEKQAHGTPSGIDAMAVIDGAAQLKRTAQNGKIVPEFSPKVSFALPKNTEFLVIDTFKTARSNTADLVRIVSRGLGYTVKNGMKETIRPLTEFTDADRKKLDPFVKIFDKISKELKPSGNAANLGKLLDENQDLLKKIGASTLDIEKALVAARKAGALGGKITGAGGIGGACIVLVKPADRERVIRAVKDIGFAVFPTNYYGKGARLLSKG